MCYLAFSANEKKDNLKEVRSQITTTAEKNQTKAVKKVKATYSLKILDGSLAVINNKTKEVFEYTDMKKENLPADIKNMLKENFIFENQRRSISFFGIHTVVKSKKFWKEKLNEMKLMMIIVGAGACRYGMAADHSS